MYESDIQAMGGTAAKKISFMEKNLLGFFLMSMMAGLYIGIGSVFMGCMGTWFNAAGSPAKNLVQGTVFAVGLCMVVLCGAELFTGNNLVLSVGAMNKSITWAKAVKYWAICWVGNLAGSLVVAVFFTLSGIPAANDNAMGIYFAGLGQAKMSGAPLNLLFKGILCNILVCIAIWGCARLKSEGAKFAMCFCCVSMFVSCGFEHSIANMTFLNIALLNPNGAAVSLGGAAYNLAIVTLGNMIGGICFVGLPYFLTGKAKENA